MNENFLRERELIRHKREVPIQERELIQHEREVLVRNRELIVINEHSLRETGTYSR